MKPCGLGGELDRVFGIENWSRTRDQLDCQDRLGIARDRFICKSCIGRERTIDDREHFSYREDRGAVRVGHNRTQRAVSSLRELANADLRIFERAQDASRFTDTGEFSDLLSHRNVDLWRDYAPVDRLPSGGCGPSDQPTGSRPYERCVTSTGPNGMRLRTADRSRQRTVHLFWFEQSRVPAGKLDGTSTVLPPAARRPVPILARVGASCSRPHGPRLQLWRSHREGHVGRCR